MTLEQEAKGNQERACQMLTRRIVELEGQLEDAENAARTAGKSKIQAMESKIRNMESDMDGEMKRRVDAEKVLGP